MLTAHSEMPALWHVPLLWLHPCAASCCCSSLGKSAGLPIADPLADALELADALLSLAACEGWISSGAGQAGGSTLAGPAPAPLLLLGTVLPAMKAPCRKAASSRAVATCILQQSSLQSTLQQVVPMQTSRLGVREV